MGYSTKIGIVFMSMRSKNPVKRRTICEILREINDMCQDKEKKSKKIRKLLVEAEKMSKKMDRKLYEYNKEYDKEGWWEKNPDYEKKFLKRLNESYIVG